LGYGNMLRKVGFDLTQETAQEAIDRLFQFQDVVARHSGRLFSTVLLNDGCVAYRTLSPSSRSVTHDFLNRAYRLHREINDLEGKQNYPGMRSVLAVGFRRRRSSDNFSRLIAGYGEFLIQKVAAKEISSKEAIIKALVAKPSFDLVPGLQANFAFAKAYLADREGSKGGFGGPNFFVDVNLLPAVYPMWLEYDLKPELKEPGIGGNFLRVCRMKRFALNEQNTDLPDAFEIAKQITGSEDVEQKLREMTVRANSRHATLSVLEKPQRD
jgi:hypothetical protein